MRSNPNSYSVVYVSDSYSVEDEFGEEVAGGFAEENEARNWIAEQIDNYEPPDVPGWEGGFAANH